MWILPTRGREASCQEVLDACMAHGVSTPGIVIVNDPDGYQHLRLPGGWRVERHPENLGLCGSINHVVRSCPDEPWYGLLGDDIFPETDGWDRKMVEAVGPNQFGNCPDGWSEPWKMCGIEVWGGDLVRAAGWLAIPGLWHCFWDDFWELVAREIGGRVVVPDVKCRSPHQFTNTQERDATFYLSYSRLAEEQKFYGEWLRTPERAEVFQRLAALIRPNAAVEIETARASVAGKSLYIATPSMDGAFAATFVLSLSSSKNLLHRHGVPHELQVLEHCSILPHARNRLCKHFLRSDKTHLLFIDDDMGWPDYAPLELLAHDKDVIAAAGVTKSFDDRRFCVSLSPETLRYDDRTGLLRVKHVGTGFMLISRRCLERFAEHYRALDYHDHREPDSVMPRWFDNDLTSGDFGEDYTFCRRWRDMGGEVWVDPSIPLHHVGKHAFTGRYSDALRESVEEKREAA